MEEIKTSSNVEFDVIYADGTRRHVSEGVLFEVEGYNMTFHNGTNRGEVVFAAGECVAEVINSMGASHNLKISHIMRVFQTLMGKKEGRK